MLDILWLLLWRLKSLIIHTGNDPTLSNLDTEQQPADGSAQVQEGN